MEDNKEFDTGIVGCSELEDLQEQVNTLEEKVRVLEQDNEDLQDDLGYANNEIGDLEIKMQKIIETYDPETIKLNVMSDITLRLNRDGLMTKELEEWLENYCRFYLRDV